MYNATLDDVVYDFHRFDVPFYFSDRDSLLPGISDLHLSLIAPVISYWTLSCFFHLLDISQWKWLEQFRIHESEEVTRRNRVSRLEVISIVITQHILQTVLGLLFLTEPEPVHHSAALEEIAWRLRPFLAIIVGEQRGFTVLGDVSYFVYWWGIPICQMFCSIFIIDTWQYFLHRLAHTNKFLYRHFHSWHHRLYVPYAFGALYNHPVEGLVLDTCGALLAESVAGLTIRQATLLFTIATLKTVDDHCGYRLPFDPLQMLTRNTADYHDIHHQRIGIKSNFSQPFFIHWDTILGTKMTREEMESRKYKTVKED